MVIDEQRRLLRSSWDKQITGVQILRVTTYQEGGSTICRSAFTHSTVYAVQPSWGDHLGSEFCEYSRLEFHTCLLQLSLIPREWPLEACGNEFARVPGGLLAEVLNRRN